MSDPSVLVAEAFKQFSQATVSALRTYEQGTRARLSQVEDDLRPFGASATMRLEISRTKPRSGSRSGQVEADRASVVNTHQAELVNQLRQEAQQWKDQCLRLEETLRGEIKAWKDHSCAWTPSTRASSTTALRTLLAGPPTARPFIVRSTSLTTAPATEHARTGQHTETRPHTPAHHARRRRRLVSDVFRHEARVRSSSNALVDNKPPSTTHPPKPRFRAWSAAADGLRHATTVTVDAPRRGRRKSSASSRRVSRRVPSDASDSVGGGDSRSTVAVGGGGDEYVDEEEVENAIASSSPGPGGKAVPWGKNHIRQLPDEEDDELMMYAKRNTQKRPLPHEIHTPRPPRPKSVTNVTASRPPATDPSTQKRRNADTNSGSISRAKRRK
ncbi:hypothetical protein EI94DRAFT_1796316 [Lactarius quietus]|nr:hypothetical protein EI94DRAFT_1796316 [Lactarius quietus]